MTKLTKAEENFLAQLGGNNLLVIKRSSLHVISIKLEKKKLITINTTNEKTANNEELLLVQKA